MLSWYYYDIKYEKEDKMKTQDEEVRMTFRIPADIYKIIVEFSKKNRRSINNEMVIALEQYLRKNKNNIG